LVRIYVPTKENNVKTVQKRGERKMRIIKNKLIIKPIHAEKSKGGVILPQGRDNGPRYGKVVAVGSDVDKQINVGQTVFFINGILLQTDEESLVVITDDDILGVK